MPSALWCTKLPNPAIANPVSAADTPAIAFNENELVSFEAVVQLLLSGGTRPIFIFLGDCWAKMLMAVNIAATKVKIRFFMSFFI